MTEIGDRICLNWYICLKVLCERRMNTDTSSTDPIVWTNGRVIEWVQNIDLEVGYFPWIVALIIIGKLYFIVYYSLDGIN